MIPTICQLLFEEVRRRQGQEEVSVQATYVQIYREQARVRIRG